MVLYQLAVVGFYLRTGHGGATMADDGTAPKRIRIVIVEDHDRVREALIARLRGEADIEVVGDVGTLLEAVDEVMRTTPDVALLDVHLPDGNGIALCRLIRDKSPGTRCIFYTSAEIGPETAADAGADAVVIKQLVGDRLVETIQDVVRAGH